MRFGRLRLAAAAGGMAAIATVWLLAEAGDSSATVAGQTAVIVGLVLFVAVIQHRENRRLAVKIDTFRRRVYGMLDDDRDLLDAPASVEVPQEHFEQLARILAANNRRLESAIDDLSRRLDPDGEHSRTAEPGRPGDELEALSVLGNATRTRL